MPEQWSERLARAGDLRARGEWAAADEEFESIFAAALRARETEVLAQALMGRAKLWVLWGRYEEAAELGELTCVIAECCGHAATQARGLNLLGVLSLQDQDTPAARSLFERALEGAYAGRDDELVGAISTNLGAMANIRGDLSDARTYYLESLGSNVRCEARTQLVLAYNNLGMVCSDAGEWMEALVYYGRAIEIAEEERDESLLALVHVNQAEPLVSTGELGQAWQTVSVADAIARRIGNSAIQADAARFFGRISATQQNEEEADRYLAESLSIAEAADLDLHAAEALEEIAIVQLRRGERGAAEEKLRAARELYAGVGAIRDLARVEARQRDLLATR